MRTTDLERELGRQLRVARWEAREFLDAFRDVVEAALRRGDVVRVAGLGSLRMSKHGRVLFRPSRRLRRELAAGRTFALNGWAKKEPA